MISIIPGIYKFNDSVTIDWEKIKENAPEDQIREEIAKQTREALGTEAGTEKLTDLRMYSFKAAAEEYNATLSMLVAHFYPLVTGQIATSKAFDFRTTSLFQEGYLFAVEKNTSASESAHNEYGDSFLSKMSEVGSNLMGEISMITGGMAKEAEVPKDGKDKTVKLSGSTGTSYMDSIKGILNGEKLIIPKIWKNSTYSKNYNINMKFFSPYGDRLSIWNNVYMPVLVLLAMTLPRQRTLATYDANYIVQVDCPGYFSIDMGAITNLSLVRGGSENLWSADGLPLSIEVSLQVEDLYNSMMVSESQAYLNLNAGLRNMFNNMAGLRGENVHLKESILSWASLKLKPISNIGNTLNAKLNSAATAVSDRFFK